MTTCMVNQLFCKVSSYLQGILSAKNLANVESVEEPDNCHDEDLS